MNGDQNALQKPPALDQFDALSNMRKSQLSELRDGQAQTTGSDLRLKMAFGDYDRTRPLIDGRVKMEGLAPTYFVEDIALFCTRPVYEEFDVVEMSFSWYVAARSRGEPVVGLPIFPLRMPVFAYMFCRADSPYRKPSDLIGKRVGSKGYRYTVNLWLRGLLKDHYGLTPQQVTWVTGEMEGAGFVIPDGIRCEVDTERTDEELLLAGEIDAIFSPVIPESFARGGADIRRLFPDAAEEQAGFYAKTGIYPITHLMVVGEHFLNSNPWIAPRLFQGFVQAQNIIDKQHLEAKNLCSPEAIFMLESTRRRYGDNIWRHGYGPNKVIVDTFVRYAYEQGYIASLLAPEHLFAPGTLDL